MIVLALLSWWYTTGWADLFRQIGRRVESVLETFSVTLLARTLFDPFRQISAGSVQGPLDVKMRALGDRVFSRLFGAIIRSFFILIGLVGAVLTALAGLLQVIIWPFVPVLPLIGLCLAVSGWTP